MFTPMPLPSENLLFCRKLGCAYSLHTTKIRVLAEWMNKLCLKNVQNVVL